MAKSRRACRRDADVEGRERTANEGDTLLRSSNPGNMDGATGTNMATLSKIKVQGFKSLADVALDVRSLNVLIGANGAGKSNFIGVFTFLNHLIESRLQFYVGQSGGPESILTNGSKQTPEMDVWLNFGLNGYHAKFSPSQGDELIFADEECWYHSPRHVKPYDIQLGAGHRETKLHQEIKAHPGGVASHVKSDFLGWKVYHFHDTSSSAKVKGTCDIDDNAFLKQDASNLAAFLMLLRDRYDSRYTQIVRAIRLVAPFFDDFALRPDPRNEKKTKLEWKSKDTDAYLNAHSLSDGTLRFICLTTLLLQPAVPTAILIDEPELGLHPYAITMLASLLKMASKRTQVIVSTQSVTLVNQFVPDDIVVVDRDDRGSTLRRPTAAEAADWLDDYSLGELWEKNIIGGRPR